MFVIWNTFRSRNVFKNTEFSVNVKLKSLIYDHSSLKRMFCIENAFSKWPVFERAAHYELSETTPGTKSRIYSRADVAFLSNFKNFILIVTIWIFKKHEFLSFLKIIYYFSGIIYWIIPEGVSFKIFGDVTECGKDYGLPNEPNYVLNKILTLMWKCRFFKPTTYHFKFRFEVH